MSGAADQANFPTMIIPKGTEIRVNHQGQLSIRTPGNLVIQNSGNYSEIESTNGSIRIEENVTVEAVSIRAGQACFALEDKARAFIMLQESETLELSRGARLVGNFANEKELFLMMGKFTSQLKELPGGVDMGATAMLAEPARVSTASIPGTVAVPQTGSAEQLRTAQTLLERELARPDLPPKEAEGLREVLYAIREHNISRISSIYRAAFAEVRTPSDSLRQAYESLDRFFASRA
jgi:hypothetical protein